MVGVSANHGVGKENILYRHFVKQKTGVGQVGGWQRAAEREHVAAVGGGESEARKDD